VEAFSSMMSSASMSVLVEAQKEGKRTCSPEENMGHRRCSPDENTHKSTDENTQNSSGENIFYMTEGLLRAHKEKKEGLEGQGAADEREHMIRTFSVPKGNISPEGQVAVCSLACSREMGGGGDQEGKGEVKGVVEEEGKGEDKGEVGCTRMRRAREGVDEEVVVQEKMLLQRESPHSHGPAAARALLSLEVGVRDEGRGGGRGGGGGKEEETMGGVGGSPYAENAIVLRWIEVICVCVCVCVCARARACVCVCVCVYVISLSVSLYM
jgi:hypothetical protein